MRHTVFALKCFRRHMLLEICSKFARNVKYCSNIAQSAQGCSKCKIVLQTQKKCSKGAQRNRIGLFAVLCHLFTFHTRLSAADFLKLSFTSLTIIFGILTKWSKSVHHNYRVYSSSSLKLKILFDHCTNSWSLVVTDGNNK